MFDDTPASDPADDRPSNDADARADSPGDGPSRRRLLVGVAGIGLLGGLAGLAGGRGPRRTTRPEVVRSDDAWRVEVAGETGLRLDPPHRFSTEDGGVTGSGNHRVGHLNAVADGVAGGTVAGGGALDHDDGEVEGNTVHSHFGVVGGGADNVAGRSGRPDRGTMATVSGGQSNRASGYAATVAGGTRNEATGPRTAVGGGINNVAEGVNAAVGGGIGNDADGTFGTVGGGGGNTASGEYAAVGGGRGNHATEEGATVAGGHKNSARAERATVGGGYYNKAHGYGAVVPGGKDNVADGDYSYAAGYHAETNGHDGAYVFADSSDEPMRAGADDAAYFQMPVHARAFNTTSTRAAKTDFEPVEPASVLEGVRDLDVGTWAFHDGDGGRHMGPTAEDFQEAFGLGDDVESIATVDADGVALAAIQGLAGLLEAATDRVDDLEAELEARDERIADLESRLTRLEEAVSGGEADDAPQASP
jgi:flagellin-like hook-associated protein FlgL